MEDLIARAKKYARSAGRIGLGQYKAAEQNEFYDRCLGWASAILSAVVGTSIFAQWVQQYPVPFGLAAIVAAGILAVKDVSKLGERANAHRAAGAEYGRIRRRVDMLRLRLEAKNDGITRTEGLAALAEIGEQLSELAKKSWALPDSIYNAAKATFDKDHLEYFDGSSHAGGVVVKRSGPEILYLIIKAKDNPAHWVLPKGHIEEGESAEQAARREVLEETGVEAAVRNLLDVVTFGAPKGPVQAKFFLMETVKEGRSQEGRELKWCSFDEAVKELSFKEARLLICEAYLLLRQQ